GRDPRRPRPGRPWSSAGASRLPALSWSGPGRCSSSDQLLPRHLCLLPAAPLDQLLELRGRAGLNLHVPVCPTENQLGLVVRVVVQVQSLTAPNLPPCIALILRGEDHPLNHFLIPVQQSIPLPARPHEQSRLPGSTPDSHRTGS